MHRLQGEVVANKMHQWVDQGSKQTPFKRWQHT